MTWTFFYLRSPLETLIERGEFRSKRRYRRRPKKAALKRAERGTVTYTAEQRRQAFEMLNLSPDGFCRR